MEDEGRILTIPKEFNRLMKRKMIDNAAKVALVADHTKFEQVSKAFVSRVERRPPAHSASCLLS